MIAKLKADCSLADKAAIIRHIEGQGLRVHVGDSGENPVVSIIGNPTAMLADELQRFAGVESISLDAPSYPLVSLGSRPGPSVVKVGSVFIGGAPIVVMAGPCSVESAEQLEEVSLGVAAGGAVMLRGGAFKPRTSPYSFQGMGEDGLKLLRDAGDRTGLGVVSECVAPEDVALMADYVDMLQIGARNMQNFRLLSAVGEQPRPVLLKRGLMSTIDEFLLAAEYIMAAGNPRVVMCERGIRSFDTSTRSTLDISAVPVLKERTHLPVIVDPSHAAGRRSLVPSLALAGVAAGADGLLIEVHNNPEVALSDGPQSLTIDGFKETMDTVSQVATAVGRSIATLPPLAEGAPATS
jgi:3-deoxy-7-phosphoheptulonate synthase